jgi:hypothetical protein
MKTRILPLAIVMALTFAACDGHGGSANDPRFQPTTPEPGLDTRPVSPSDRSSTPVDTIGVDSLRDRSLDRSLDSARNAARR